LFSSKGGTLAESGAVNWMFERMGVIRAQDGNMTEEKLLEDLLDYDINDIKAEGNQFTIYCNMKSLDAVKSAVEKIGMKVEGSEVEWVAKNTTSLEDEQANKVFEFLGALEDHEDVKNVYANLV